jgi:hypothetical protein
MNIKIYKNKKGIAPLFSGILILLISIIFMGIIITFAIQYFNNLEDLQKYKNNKNNLALINELVIDLKESSVGTSKKIFFDPTNTITFDSETDFVIIEQEIKNQRIYDNQKSNYKIGNLNIKKKYNMFEFTLDLNGIVDINNTINLTPAKQTISFTVVDDRNLTSIQILREK